MVNFSLILINFHSLFFLIMISNSISISIFSPTVELYKKADSYYIMFSDAVGWIEARGICQTYEAELAIPNTTSKAKSLAYFIKIANSKYQQFWIGAYHKNAQWLWCDNQKIENINFTAINHNTLNSENKCLVQMKQLYFKPLFAEQMCFFPKPFICERSIFAEIRNPLLTLPVKSTKINSSVFTIYHSKVALNQAVAYCRSLDQRLAIVSDNFTLYALTRVLLQSRPYIENAWIGGYYHNYNWVWLANGNKITSKTDLPWIKKSNSNFTEACLLFGRHLNRPYFVPSRCEKKKGFICEKFDDVLPNNKSKIECFNSKTEMTIYLTNKTWIDAQKFCQSKNTTLAEIYDKKTLEILTLCLEDQYLAPKHFWLGAIRKRTDWIWASSYKNINSSISLCSDEFEPHMECLNLDKSNNQKPLIYGIQCKKEQAFVCQKNRVVLRRRKHCGCPCKQHSVSISYNSKTYLVLLFVIAYERVDYYCKHFGGKLIDSTLSQHTKSYIFSYIEQLLVTCCCPLDRINIWLKSESNTSCMTINAKSHKINTTVDCTKKNAFICQIDCGIPTNILANKNASTKCELIKKQNGYSYNSCTFHCPDGYSLFGPSKFICDAYGWGIHVGNKEVSFLYPECIKIKYAGHGFIEILKNLNFQGYYFIIKEQENWEKIKHFIINFMKIFGVSKDLPIGLMTFGNSVDVRIPYNGTNLCQVISTLHKINIRSNKSNIANYNLAFNEMQDQISKYRPKTPTLIIFIADSKNTGEPYLKMLRKLKRKNVVCVIGISKNIVDDFDIVANLPINHRVHTMKINNHNEFYNISIELQNHKDWRNIC